MAINARRTFRPPLTFREGPGERSVFPGNLPSSRTPILVAFMFAMASTCWAQLPRSDALAARALGETPPLAADADTTATMSILELFYRGGWLMVPIAVMSVIVVAIAVERMLALRRSAILPRPLAKSLNEMVGERSFNRAALLQLCDRYPSSASRIVKTTLNSMGRPIGELERTVSEACQREAERLYTNVRTLNLASTITPLLGLLGTVWGMIQAFFATANMPIGSNKGAALAEGIYVALVTTFAGLSVAIPAAVLAHLFESRILRKLRGVEELLGKLLPQLSPPSDEKLRVDRGHNGPGPMTTPLPAVRRESKAS